MVNRLSYFRSIDRESSILVDNGNIFSIEKDSLKNSYVKKIVPYFGYDAIGFGLNDIPMVDSLNFLSLNLRDHSSVKIVEKGGIKFGIISFFDRSWVSFKNSKIGRIKRAQFRGSLKRLEKDTDFIIFLSQLESFDEEKFFLEHEEIDLFISSSYVAPDFYELDNRYFGLTGSNCEYIGKLTLQFDDMKRVTKFNNSFIELDEGLFPPDKIGNKIIEQYNFAYSVKLQRDRLLDDRYSYYPDQFCNDCHTISEGIHNNSFHSVRDKGAECLVCHTTGFGTKTGYNSETRRDEMKNIGCTQCHKIPNGTNFQDQFHNVIEVMPSTCKECHIKPHVKEFHYYKSKRKLLQKHKVDE